MLSRRKVVRTLLFGPWWLVLALLWTFFTHAVTIRDNLLPVEWRPKLQVLDHVPTWPWWVWALGVLTLTVVMVLASASRWIMRLERALNDRALPGRNASEIAPWRERGRTLTNQWRHLIQHGAASEYQAAAQEAEAWRQDMRQRLDRKYGVWIGTHFNETREVDSAGLPFLSHLAEHDARAERLAQIMYDVGTSRIPPISEEPF